MGHARFGVDQIWATGPEKRQWWISEMARLPRLDGVGASGSVLPLKKGKASSEEGEKWARKEHEELNEVGVFVVSPDKSENPERGAQVGRQCAVESLIVFRDFPSDVSSQCRTSKPEDHLGGENKRAAFCCSCDCCRQLVFRSVREIHLGKRKKRDRNPDYNGGHDVHNAADQDALN
jgi:hypothetical protein